VPAYGPQNDVTLKMPAFEWVHVQLHQQKGMISLSPPTICNSALHDTITRNHQCRSMWQLLKKVRHFMETASPFPGGKHGQAKV
ncbi:hypothetical protein ABKU14_23105, partial (plasmid) [Enterobacter roggenkampii]|nr:hypothetical protein [Escherichia coli]